MTSPRTPNPREEKFFLSKNLGGVKKYIIAEFHITVPLNDLPFLTNTQFELNSKFCELLLLFRFNETRSVEQILGDIFITSTHAEFASSLVLPSLTLHDLNKKRSFAAWYTQLVISYQLITKIRSNKTVKIL